MFNRFEEDMFALCNIWTAQKPQVEGISRIQRGVRAEDKEFADAKGKKIRITYNKIRNSIKNISLRETATD